MMWFIYAPLLWLSFTVLGTLTLYPGYGFAMAAKIARDKAVSPSQRMVVKFDSFLVIWYVLLDFLLNRFCYSVLMLDFRWSYTWTLATKRFCLYSQDPNERAFRRWTADVVAAFLDAKDPSGDHVKGVNVTFTWLD